MHFGGSRPEVKWKRAQRMSIDVNIEKVLGDFCLETKFIAGNGITAIFGPSGAGKSTLVNLIAGLMKPNDGYIKIFNELIFDSEQKINVPVNKRGIGFVFQDARLFPHMKVEANLKYSHRFGRMGQIDSFTEIVKVLNLGQILHRLPGNLSGGEKQRVAIGRVLLSNPKILIFDEPFSGLDEGLKAEVIPYVEFLRDNFNLPILYISHSQSEVARLSDQIVVLEKGRIIEKGKTIQILSSLNVAKMLGLRDLSSFIEATVCNHAPDGITELDFVGSRLFLPKIDAPVGRKVCLRILAKDITLAIDKPQKISALNILEGEVVEIILGSGPGAVIGLKVGKHKLITRITQRSLNAMDLKLGQTCFAFLKTVSIATSDIIV